MNIHKAADLTRLSKRTLHHYDDIGLLRPKRQDANGYRDYTHADLQRLEEILLYREMGFKLNDIKRLLESSGADKTVMMEKHKDVLLAKRARINRIIALIDKRIEGDKDMDFKAFDREAIEQAKAKYAAEVKERWGETDAYSESRRRTKKYTDEDWAKINAEAGAIFDAFYAHKAEKPESEARLALVETWRQHISQYYYTGTYEILQGLGEMYAMDERFSDNIDLHGAGTARAMAESIKVLCEQKINNN